MTAEENDTRNWFLRISSGVVFGPVPTKALRLWAEQGRVQPGNEISADRKNWIPAQSLDELDMFWYLEDNQGNLTGPFNKRAAEKLIADGRVGEGTSIIHKDDADLAHLVRPAMENRRKTHASSTDPEFDFGDSEDAAASDENALRTECEGLRLRIEVLEKSQKQLLSAAEKECKSHEKQLAAERAKVSALEKELEESKLTEATALNAKKEAEDARDALRAELEKQHKAEIDGLVSRHAAELEAVKTEMNAKVSALSASDTGAKADNEALKAELEQLKSDFAEVLSFSNERDAESLARIAVLEEQSARREKTSAELERKCAELERKCAELKSSLDEAGKKAASAAAPTDTTGVSGHFVATQIEYLSSLFSDGQKKQKALQEKIDELARIRSGDLAEAIEQQARQRADRAEIRRSKEQIESLRLDNVRISEQAEAREKELRNRVRALEIDLSQAMGSAREADALRQQIQNLTEEVNERDQLIVRERKERAEEQQQLEQAQEALIHRLEALEKKDSGTDDQQSAASQRTFHAPPWMTFK